jgi:hypothetical protein
MPQDVLDSHDGFRPMRASQLSGVRLTRGDASAIQHLRSSGVFLSGQNKSDLNQIFARTRLGAVRFSTNNVPRNCLNPALAPLTGTPFFFAHMRSSAGTDGEQQLRPATPRMPGSKHLQSTGQCVLKNALYFPQKNGHESVCFL